MKKSYFKWVVNNPLKVIVVGVMLIVFGVLGMTRIVKDTSADAFIKANDPALVSKNKLVELFDLNDPMVISIQNDKGIYNQETLNVVYDLSKEIQEKFSEVQNDGITSLSRQKNIKGVTDGMEIEYFVQHKNLTPKEIEDVQKGIAEFPMLQGVLVSKDSKATLIIADLKQNANAEKVYKKLVNLVKKYETDNIKLYVAGEGAVTGYMGAYIDHDARILNPAAGIIITIILFIAFRTIGGTLLPNVIIAGGVTVALGLMGYAGISFFIITNALPVVLIGISVADSIHILSTYYERRRDFPDESINDAVVETMLEMFRPVTLTTITTIAGFVGLSLSSVMPPMYYFGLFASIGVGMAWVYSLSVLPAMMAKFKLKQSKLFVKKEQKTNRFASKMAGVIMKHHHYLLASTALIVLIGVVGFSKMIINEDRLSVFSSDEPLVKADHEINTHFNGSHYLDILVQTKEPEGLFDPNVMQKVEALQEYAKTLKHVQGSISYIDYLKQMNKSLNENRGDFYKLPDSSEAASQFFLLYNASASSDDFDNILDYDYQKANIRIYVNSGEYIKEKPIVLALKKYVKEHFNSSDLHAEVSGRVNIDFEWVNKIENSHFKSIAISLLLVILMAWISFRSFFMSILVTLPVVLSILTIYAVMGFSDIWLGVGTSMFASIAIGLGVDFAVHTAERMEYLYAQGLRGFQRVEAFYASTGRALYFNALALALGFGVLVVSKVVVLEKFGALVAVAIASSFIFALVLIPSILVILEKKDEK